MGDYALSRDELILLAIGAFVVVVIPSWCAIFRNRREANRRGYRPAAHGYHAGIVLLSLLPLTGVLFAWFLVSAGLLGILHERLPEKLMGGMPWMLFLFDLGALVMALHICMPAGYLKHMQDTPKGLHTPLDWLVGLLLTVIFFPAMILQIGFVLGLGAE